MARQRIVKEEGEADMSATEEKMKNRLAARIRKNGDSLKEKIGKPSYPKEPGGLYQVIFGTVHLGYEDGEAVVVNTGGQLELTSEEASRMVFEGTVKKVA